ncbi:hypothetical protein HI914_00953 [Erysiphe necator]|nr:hypothetical protein HI914_00953 [Erysiphe necator]
MTAKIIPVQRDSAAISDEGSWNGVEEGIVPCICSESTVLALASLQRAYKKSLYTHELVTMFEVKSLDVGKIRRLVIFNCEDSQSRLMASGRHPYLIIHIFEWMDNY